MKTLFALVVSLALATPALAVPYTLEFISGGITGTVTMEAFPDPISSPNVPALSWNIRDPFGVVWDSSNPEQGFHENKNFGGGLILHPELLANRSENYLLIITDGPTNQAPNMRSGTYSFETAASGREGIFGTGEWRSVPGPGTLWSLGFSLLALSIVVWLQHRREGAVTQV